MKISRFYLFPLLVLILTPIGIRAQDLLETPLPPPILTAWLIPDYHPQIPAPSGARLPGADFYAAAHKLVFPTHADIMRKAVQTLGVAQHRFVRCDLRDGTSLVGGITSIEQDRFSVSQGIMSSRVVSYSELKQVPEAVAGTGEHVANSLEWTGLVILSVAAFPLALAMGITCGFNCS